MNLLTDDVLDKHIPPYLVGSSRRKLVEELKQFPNSVTTKKFYTGFRENYLRQGDAFQFVDMPIYSIKEFREVSAVLLTNTCSADLENEKALDRYLTFAPLFDFKELKRLFSLSQEEIRIYEESHFTNMIYFPPTAKYEDGTIALLDQCFSLPLTAELSDKLISNRIMTLSQFGWYFFLFKISYWFCRMGEQELRG